jgi:hypothetical protein
MDETILQLAWKGMCKTGDPWSELRKEGQTEFWKSELGWAKWLDSQGQSYNMNERVSLAKDGYLQPSVMDFVENPGFVARSVINKAKKIAYDPGETFLVTISNDKSGSRSWGAYSEIESRTHKPKKGYTRYGLGGRGVFGFGARDIEAAREQVAAAKKR